MRGIGAVDRTLVDNPHGPIIELPVGANDGVGVLSGTCPNTLNEIERARDPVRGIDPWGIKRCRGLQRLGLVLVLWLKLCLKLGLKLGHYHDENTCLQPLSTRLCWPVQLDGLTTPP